MVIEVSGPKTARQNLLRCAELGLTTVCGSTGWLEDWNQVVSAFKTNNTSFLYASNFSIGMNVFFEINKLLAKQLPAAEYRIKIEETHHTQKLDAPSGTAISLANQIIDNNPNYDKWELASSAEKTLNIEAHRLEDVKGTHTISFESRLDKITIEHEAFSRDAFAEGAINAIKWLENKNGIFGMEDVLK